MSNINTTIDWLKTNSPQFVQNDVCDLLQIISDFATTNLHVLNMIEEIEQKSPENIKKIINRYKKDFLVKNKNTKENIIKIDTDILSFISKIENKSG